MDRTECPLARSEQTQNVILYGINVGLVYLGAPVLYVGIVQAALCKRLGASDAVANLPISAYFWATPLPIIVAWHFCAVRQLKPVLVVSYAVTAVMALLVVAALFVPTPAWACPILVSVGLPPNWVILAVILHAFVLGWSLGVVGTYGWEVLGRGVSESRRGQAMGLAFGVGPLFAVLGSLGSQLVLDGRIGAVAIPRIDYPWNFAVLFAATAPLMALAALLSTSYRIPPAPIEVARQPLFSGIFGGLGDFFSYRLILGAAIAYILVASGYNILTNISNYTWVATGKPAQAYVGYQNALRFGFKIVAGLFLGWLLTKTNPKSGLLITGGFCLLSVLWALWAPGQWFLLSFGLMGAGELMGAYYPNYILCCSAPSRMRRNMAYASMLMMPTGLAPLLFGKISDHFGSQSLPEIAVGMVAAAAEPLGLRPFAAAAAVSGGASVMRFGYQMSFLASVALLVAGLLLVLLFLPARPRPRQEAGESSKAAEEYPSSDPASPAMT